MINTADEASKAIEQLNSWTKLYDEGHPQVSDKQWDDLYFELDDYERRTGDVQLQSPTQRISFTVVNKLNKVKHNHLMLSLDKTKDLNDVYDFLRNHDWIAMLKMDGLTCSLLYEDGELVSAETRGNGEIGEDILHNALFIKHIPHHIETTDRLVVDGEIICTYDDFQPFANFYKNPRNFASGSARLLDNGECKHRNLSFVAWDCIEGLDYLQQLHHKLRELHNLGFRVVPYVWQLDEAPFRIEDTIQELVETAQDCSYPIDGIVFKYDNCSEYIAAGQTNHHFSGGLAYKFYDETYATKLKYISWTMGRTGQLTPVAVFDPVEIDGTEVERASLHNLSIMREILGPCAYVGETLEVFKANQIIPQIADAGPWMDLGEVIREGQICVDEINVCPYCGEHVTIRHEGIADICYCSNPQCSGKVINQFEHFCGKKGLDIKGLSKATLEKLLNWEWLDDFCSIFKLNKYRQEWIKKPGFGVASVDKILNAIDESRTTQLWRVIAAAGISEIGVAASRVLARYYKTWDNFRQAIHDEEDFSKLPDFGYIMNKRIHEYDYEVMDKVVKFLDIIDMNEIDSEESDSIEQPLQGKQFCITGKVVQWKNREELKAYIESLGGKVAGSVTNRTDYLINNDCSSTTTKNVQAQKLGKPILTEKDFSALVSDLLAN